MTEFTTARHRFASEGDVHVAAGPKDILWTDGGQLDFYDQPAQVAIATATVVDHFTTTPQPHGNRAEPAATHRTGEGYV